MKLIDGDKLRDMLHTATEPMTQYGIGVHTGFRYARAFIDNMPEAHPTKHGRWIDKDNTGDDWDGETICALCGGVSPCRLFWDYCPHCGAKMDGGAEDAAD